MVGILVHGDNHFIASGPLPDLARMRLRSLDTGPSFKSERQRRLRSIDGKSFPESSERTWRGQ